MGRFDPKLDVELDSITASAPIWMYLDPLRRSRRRIRLYDGFTTWPDPLDQPQAQLPSRPQTVPTLLWARVPNAALVSETSNMLRNGFGNYNSSSLSMYIQKQMRYVCIYIHISMQKNINSYQSMYLSI